MANDDSPNAFHDDLGGDEDTSIISVGRAHFSLLRLKRVLVGLTNVFLAPYRPQASRRSAAR